MKLNREDWDNLCYRLMYPDKESSEKLERFLGENKELNTKEILAVLNNNKVQEV